MNDAIAVDSRSDVGFVFEQQSGGAVLFPFWSKLLQRVRFTRPRIVNLPDFCEGSFGHFLSETKTSWEMSLELFLRLRFAGVAGVVSANGIVW